MEAEFEKLDWDGRRCKVKPLGAEASRQVGLRLLNLIGQGMKEAGMAGETAIADLIIAGAALESLDDNAVRFLNDKFLAVTVVETEAGLDVWKPAKDVQELAFGGGEGLARWARWMAFCLELSCGDFFAELRGQVAARQAKALAAKMAKPSASPST